jgi:methyl-accepting chemotaxis protein
MVDANGRSYVVGGTVLKDFSGQNIGVLEVASDVTSIAQGRSTVLWSMGLAMVAVCGVVLIGFLFFARALAGAIGQLTSTMGRLAAGELGTEVTSQDRPDEIGAMARAVQVFKDSAIEKSRLEAEAAANSRAAREERSRNEIAQARIAREQIFVVESLARGLVQLSNGDLAYRLTAAFGAEYEKLRNDFNAAMDKLQDTMTIIAGNTQMIQSGAGEISRASDDLSRRTEQQAASLEQTAAALDEITATVKQTAEGARHARTAASSAKTDAEHSGEVVRNAVAAMSDIEKSSAKVSQIIGVIDEIAFQTNLLALNAGVEAARAGEAGRGFAVVASEVRALAQRSAEAAKEIKGLIQASTVQVAAGVDLVSETGEVLGRIAVQVAEINSVIVGIATSAQEQAVGLQEVNTAVNQMDQVTQQNAAMVEETTAASHSLAQEANELSRLINGFRVDRKSGLSERSERSDTRIPHRARAA